MSKSVQLEMKQEILQLIPQKYKRSFMATMNIFMAERSQDGWSLTARDCSSQWKSREQEDATLSDKFSSPMDQKIPSGGAPRVASATLVAGAAVLPAPWHGSSSCRVNRTGSPTDPVFGAPGRQSRLLRTQEGSQTSDSRAEEHHQSYRCYFGWCSGLLGFQHWESINWMSTQKPN